MDVYFEIKANGDGPYAKRNANLVSTGGERSDLHELSNIDDPAKEERRKIEEMARNVPTDSIYMGNAFDKRSPLGTVPLESQQPSFWKMSFLSR